MLAMDQKVRLVSWAFLFYWVFHPALVKMPLIFVRLFFFAMNIELKLTLYSTTLLPIQAKAI